MGKYKAERTLIMIKTMSVEIEANDAVLADNKARTITEDKWKLESESISNDIVVSFVPVEG